MSDLVVIKDTILSVKERFEALAPTEINFQKEMQFAMQIIEGSSYLAGVCIKNPESLRNAVMNISTIGLSLNPATKLAYLVPRGGKICLDISYMGLVRLATDSGSILWVQCQIVRKEDKFIYHGAGLRPTHDFDYFSEERGDMVGVYCIAKTIDGEFLCNPMSIGEVFDIRERTEAYKAYLKNGTSCPWVTDFIEMAKKTSVRRDYKLWPSSPRLSKAIEILNQHDGIDFSKEKQTRDITPPLDSDLDKLQSLVSELENGETRLLAHLNIKYKPKEKIESLNELNLEQVNYSLGFIGSHVEEARKIKSTTQPGAQA